MYERIYNLIEQKDIVNLKLELLKLNEADIAEILDEIDDNEKRIRIFRLLPKTIAADVFADLDLDNQQNIITSLSMKEAGTILDNLFADDAVDLIEEMPANIVTKLLKNTTKETRADINFLLKYPINSAGSIMNTAYIDLKENITVNQAIEKIRKEKEDTETLNICFVLDKERKLKGAIFLKDLLFNKPETLIKDIMETKVLYVNTYDDQEEVANSFSKYDVNTMPVVDSENRMVGIITIDDIVDITDVVCPTTFVKAKVALEELDDGQILAVRMNNGEPVQNVPRSIKEEGHQILKLNTNDDGTYTLFVKKVGE